MLLGKDLSNDSVQMSHSYAASGRSMADLSLRMLKTTSHPRHLINPLQLRSEGDELSLDDVNLLDDDIKVGKQH